MAPLVSVLELYTSLMCLHVWTCTCMHILYKRSIEEGEHACTGDAQNLIPEGVDGKLAVHEIMKLSPTNQTEPAIAHSYDTATVDSTWLQWNKRSARSQSAECRCRASLWCLSHCNNGFARPENGHPGDASGRLAFSLWSAECQAQGFFVVPKAVSKVKKNTLIPGMTLQGLRSSHGLQSSRCRASLWCFSRWSSKPRALSGCSRFSVPFSGVLVLCTCNANFVHVTIGNLSSPAQRQSHACEYPAKVHMQKSTRTSTASERADDC